MPISLVKPLQEIANMDATLKKQAKGDKPKEMTEYQKEKVEIAKKQNELKAQQVASKEANTKAILEKEARLKEKQSIQQERLNKESEAKIERSKIQSQIELQSLKNQELKEKRLLQNSKNRQARIKAIQSLQDEVMSLRETKSNYMAHLGELKTGPKQVGFKNINPGGEIKDE